MNTKFELSPEATLLNAAAIAEINDETRTPFHCNNCDHKPTAEEVIRLSGACSKCGDDAIAYSIEVAEFILKSTNQSKPMTTQEKRKTASKTLEAYFEFMRLDASAKDIINWIARNAARGVDWRGCTKSSMAESWAVHAATEKEEHGITTPPFERLKAEFGLKSKY